MKKAEPYLFYKKFVGLAMEKLIRYTSAGGIAIVALVVATWTNLPTRGELRHRALSASYATEVFDRDGEYVGLIPPPNSSTGRNGPYTRIEDVPNDLVSDLVTIEGMKAYGFSTTAFIRAALGQGGGSTLTQQMVRTVLDYDAHSIPRKWAEMIGAVKASLAFKRKTIIEIYLNQVQWTRSRFTGIAVASRKAFDKRPRELVRNEWLCLMAALPAPSLRGGCHSQDISKPYRRRVNLLHEEGRISEQERHDLRSLPSRNPPRTVPTELFENRVAERLASLGGRAPTLALEVRTTLDLDQQRAAHQNLQANRDRATFLLLNGMQAVLSYYGGGGGFDPLRSSRTLPSSRMKPFVYSALAADLVREKGYTAAEILETEMSDSIQVRGEVFEDDDVDDPSILESLKGSLNPPAYDAITRVGPERFARFASELGLEVPARPSVALGSVGVSELDLTAAYSSLLLREGRPPNDPSFLLEVRDRRTGDVLWERGDSARTKSIVPEPAVRAIEEALHEAVSSGTVEGLTAELGQSSNLLRQMDELFAKTGTSPASSDYRFLGVSGAFGGDKAFSLTVQGDLSDRVYASDEAVPAARRVLNDTCQIEGPGC